MGYRAPANRLLIILLVACMSASGSRAAELEQGLGFLVKKLSRASGFSKKKPSQKVVAVLPFENAVLDLEQRHIGYGISELLIASIAAFGKDAFTIVEKSQIDKILQEQKISRSGLTKSMIKGGELLGANLLVTGKVAQVKKKYVIKIVLEDVEKGKVLFEGNVEFDTDELEKRVKDFVVPRKKVIGISAGLLYMPLGMPGFSSMTNPAGSVLESIDAKNWVLFSVVSGRFYPAKKLMVEFGAMSTFAYNIFAQSITNESGSQRTNRELEGFIGGVLLTAAYVISPKPRFDVYLGTGLYALFPSFGHGEIILSRKTFPRFTLGTEWRPSGRTGLSMFIDYHLGTQTVKGNLGDSLFQNVDVFKILPISLIFNLTTYF